MAKSQIAVRIPQTLLDSLNEYVDHTGITKTEVVVDALRRYLGDQGTQSLSQRVTVLEAQMQALHRLFSESDRNE